MEKRVMISRARREPFDLFEQVVSRRRLRVLIGHHDSDDEAVLISRKELERLEAKARSAEAAEAFFSAEHGHDRGGTRRRFVRCAPGAGGLARDEVRRF